jgi:hypothetical protein
LRFGLGASTTAGEIDEAAERIIKVVRELRRQKDRQKTPGSSRHQPS